MRVRASVAAFFGVAAAAGATFLYAMRFADGPLGPVPGGRLASGRYLEAPVEDWDFAEHVSQVELQLLEPERSRTTWILVRNRRAYIPCGAPETMLKQWPQQALRDGRAVVRIEGQRYPVTLVLVDHGGTRVKLEEVMQRKYPASRDLDTEVWYFRLTQLSASR